MRVTKKEIHVNDRLSLNSLIFVLWKVTIPLCSRVRVRQNSLEHLWTSSGTIGPLRKMLAISG